MLFSGTIAENIAHLVSNEQINVAHLDNAPRIAVSQDFFRNLPEGTGQILDP